ncbi:hypothetical protein QFC24_005729 [Naganishia onofrii]|uniref:Uncharacterized protein n=1 Tax=Naganishia onofrii TaxID=1851511 RepID=A0ACC2X5F3_9TREE|nr:hypothetical protein QFC24_005729 [Naganishia onofrii]
MSETINAPQPDLPNIAIIAPPLQEPDLGPLPAATRPLSAQIRAGKLTAKKALRIIRRNLLKMGVGILMTFSLQRDRRGNFVAGHTAPNKSISNEMVLARREQAQPPDPETMWFDDIVDQITHLVERMPRNTRMKLEIKRTDPDRFDWTSDHPDVNSGHAQISMLPSLEERQHRTGMHLVDWALDVMSSAVGAMPISTQLVLEIKRHVNGDWEVNPDRRTDGRTFDWRQPELDVTWIAREASKWRDHAESLRRGNEMMLTITRMEDMYIWSTNIPRLGAGIGGQTSLSDSSA